MDVSQLHECFLATLQADPRIRTHAESQLQQLSQTVGFLGACLDILSNETVQPIIKQSCSIYVKNTIVRRWDSPNSSIDKDERPIIREKLLVSMTKITAKSILNPLLPALVQIIKIDFPAGDWPNLLDTIKQLISSSSNDIHALYVGIFALSEVFRTFRWKNNTPRSSTLDPIIESFFPTLLSIGNQLISDIASVKSSYEGSEILK